MSARAFFKTHPRRPAPARPAPHHSTLTTQPTPGIAVVMAGHNAAAWLPRCLASISRALAGFHWMLIYADDGSTDGSAAVVDQWSTGRTGAAQVLIRNYPKAATVSIAKNRAFADARRRAADYPFVAPMDADDEMLPDRIRGLLPALKNGVRAVVGDFERERDGRVALHRVTLDQPLFGPWASLFEATLIPANGELFRPDLEAHSDLLLWDEWNRRGINWRAINGVVTHVHHYHAGSVSNPIWAAVAERRRDKLAAARRELDAAFRAKISYCTTCMGRLHHLRETLPASLAAHPLGVPPSGGRVSEPAEAGTPNGETPNGPVEFCLLDYHSVDQKCEHRLLDYVMIDLRPHLFSGQLKYQRTDKPTYFRQSHAKNIAHRMATGEILVNLDADNTATAAFTEHVRCVFARGMDGILHIFDHDPAGRHTYNGGGAGRIAISRENFYLLGGYDEALNDGGWGGEDLDLCRRAVALGLRDCPLNFSLVRFIPHDDEDRVSRLLSKDKMATNAAAVAASALNIAAGRLEANAGKPWGTL